MDVTQAIRRIRLRCAHCDEDSTQLGEEIADLLRQLPAVEGRALIRHAYWRMPDVPTAALHVAVGGRCALQTMAGRGPIIGECQTCGRLLRAHHRDLLDEESPPLCASCQASPTPSAALTADALTADAITGPAAGAGTAACTWEFQGIPRPWQPRAQVISSEVRHWAEHYPDTSRA